MYISDIKAREVLDSRGTPTIETEIKLTDNTFTSAIVPSGASKGKNEALEIRDGGSRYNGMGVMNAVSNVNNIIKQKLTGMKVENQEDIDHAMIELDGTSNKSNLGANAILSVSMATIKAAAKSTNIPLYKYIEYKNNTILTRIPIPMINIINGGMHADNNIDIQESMIIPNGARSVKDAIQMSSEVIYQLKKILKQNNLSINVGDEGGFAPNVKTNEDSIKLILDAIHNAKYTPEKDISIALDVAASSFYKNNIYNLDGKTMNAESISEFYKNLCEKYPIISIEDPVAEEAYNDWEIIMNKIGNKVNIVGDDLFTTNIKLLNKYHTMANAILIKPNQVGTITETFNTIQKAKEYKYKIIISHRSGETEDTTISHIAFGINADYIKTGSLCRSERVAKYNEMLRIEDDINSNK